jgi:hypothetical protein
MNQAISRRDFFGATLAAAVLPAMVRSASPGPKRLVAGTRVLEVNGRPAFTGSIRPQSQTSSIFPRRFAGWATNRRIVWRACCRNWQPMAIAGHRNLPRPKEAHAPAQ